MGDRRSASSTRKHRALSILLYTSLVNLLTYYLYLYTYINRIERKWTHSRNSLPTNYRSLVRLFDLMFRSRLTSLVGGGNHQQQQGQQQSGMPGEYGQQQQGSYGGQGQGQEFGVTGGPQYNAPHGSGGAGSAGGGGIGSLLGMMNRTSPNTTQIEAMLTVSRPRCRYQRRQCQCRKWK